MAKIPNIDGEVSVNFKCPRFDHNADEREVPFVKLRRRLGLDGIAELVLDRTGRRLATFLKRRAGWLQSSSQLLGASFGQLVRIITDSD